MRFGYQFLGPFLVDWYNRLSIASEEVPANTIYLLGREGWTLTPLFSMMEALRGGRRRFLYLHASRALLTHISLSNPDYADFGFKLQFNGNVRQFFESRLGLHFDLLDMPAVGDQQIVLPRDTAYVQNLLAKSRGIAVGVATKSLDAYGRYLIRSGFSADAVHILSDLGFRGTTQALLSALYGYRIKGFYAMLDRAGVPEAPPLAPGSVAGLFVDDQSFGQDYEPLDRSLLLEVLLTAPFGQVSGIQDMKDDIGDPFLYRAGGPAQKNFQIVAQCTQGAQKFVLDNIDLLGSSDYLIGDFELFFESYRQAIASEIQMFRPIMGIDDSFFGQDRISAEEKL